MPARYRSLFARCARQLESHRGHDLGALDLARHLARRLRVRLSAATTTRLLCDLNRSAVSRSVFSEMTRRLPRDERARILNLHHTPHRTAVARRVGAGGGHVLHVAVHTFTPRLKSQTRNADVGLLYDPARRREVAWAQDWRDALRESWPKLRVRRNYPYRGSADGLTTHFRTLWPDSRYAGLELEVNQALLRQRATARELHTAVAESLAALLGLVGPRRPR